VRIGFLGGSFDPVHIGHLFIAEVARVRLGYDRVIFSPANRSPHKRDARYSDAEHRLRMLDLALSARDDFEIFDWELKNGGVSYTIDSIRHLYDTASFEGRPGLIVGDDVAGGLSSWRDIDRLVELVDIVVMSRGVSTPGRVEWPHTLVDNVRLPISASDIRDRVGNGDAFRYLVPEPVYEYIVESGLYANTT
jgi:nicotinate-nucleotide adenylyltransferase